MTRIGIRLSTNSSRGISTGDPLASRVPLRQKVLCTIAIIPGSPDVGESRPLAGRIVRLISESATTLNH